MKKSHLLVLVASLVAAGVSGAAECRPAREFEIKKPLDFSRVGVDVAMKKMVESTPYSIQGNANSAAKIGAEGISGNLATILDEISNKMGLSWSQEGCVIKYSSLHRAEADGSAQSIGAPLSVPNVMAAGAMYEVRAGDDLRAVLKRWAATEGWDVFWDISEFDAIELGASAKFSGPYKNATKELVRALIASGEKVYITFHDKNMLTRVSRYAN